MEANLIEPCCGSAALSLYALEAPHPGIVPYHGSKWRFRKPLMAAALATWGVTQLQPVLLNDIGPWGRIWGTLFNRVTLAGVRNMLNDYAREDPRVIYDRIRGYELVPVGDVAFAAQFLFLQRLSIRGKAVGTRNRRWRSPGFSTSSAYGSAKRPGFGPIYPMIPRLVLLLDRWDDRLDWDRIEKVSFRGTVEPIRVCQSDARKIPVQIDGPTVVYIDPNYKDTTGYPNGALSRADLIALALSWAAAGALVMISEAEPVPELVALGWTTILLAGPNPTNGSPFKSKRPEWLTMSPPV